MGKAAQSYWGLVLLLVVFGFITGFSIGIPFLLLGVALAGLSCSVLDRGSSGRVWPWLLDSSSDMCWSLPSHAPSRLNST